MPPPPAAVEMTTWRWCLRLSDPQQRKYLATGIILEALIKANATLGPAVDELAYGVPAFVSLLGGVQKSQRDPRPSIEASLGQTMDLAAI